MRFSCSTANMAAALGMVTRAIAARSTIPIMEGVSLTSCPEGLRMICTDLALGIETFIDASFSREGTSRQVEDNGDTRLQGRNVSYGGISVAVRRCFNLQRKRNHGV